MAKLTQAKGAMTNNHQYIKSLCNELHDSGLIPSVGLIRSRTTIKLSIKEVIEVLKHWKSNPNTHTKTDVNDTAFAIVAEQSHERRIAFLENEVSELRALLEKLMIQSNLT